MARETCDAGSRGDQPGEKTAPCPVYPAWTPQIEPMSPSQPSPGQQTTSENTCACSGVSKRRRESPWARGLGRKPSRGRGPGGLEASRVLYQEPLAPGAQTLPWSAPLCPRRQHRRVGPRAQMTFWSPAQQRPPLVQGEPDAAATRKRPSQAQGPQGQQGPLGSQTCPQGDSGFWNVLLSSHGPVLFAQQATSGAGKQALQALGRAGSRPSGGSGQGRGSRGLTPSPPLWPQRCWREGAGPPQPPFPPRPSRRECVSESRSDPCFLCDHVLHRPGRPAPPRRAAGAA